MEIAVRGARVLFGVALAALGMYRLRELTVSQREGESL